MSYDSWLAEPYEYPEGPYDEGDLDSWEGTEADPRTWTEEERKEANA